MAVSLWMAVGAMWAGSTLCWAWPSPGKGPCPGHLSPCSFSPSPQCGEGTPHVTGFFEVMVAGKLVHSKKVRVTSSFGACRGQGPGGCLGPSSLFPSPSRPQRGDGYVDTESKFLKLVAAIKAALAQD